MTVARDTPDWPPLVIDADARDAAGNRLWMTPQMAAGAAGVQPRTVIRWCERYAIGAQLPSGRWLIYRPRLATFRDVR